MNGYMYFIGKEIKFQEIKKHSYMVTQRLSEISWSGDPAEAILLPHLLCKTHGNARLENSYAAFQSLLQTLVSSYHFNFASN